MSVGLACDRTMFSGSVTVIVGRCVVGRRGGAEVIGGSREVSVRVLLLACQKFVVCESLKGVQKRVKLLCLSELSPGGIYGSRRYVYVCVHVCVHACACLHVSV